MESMMSNKVFRKACYFVLFLLSFFIVDAKASNDIRGTVGLELGVASPILDKEVKEDLSDKYRFNFAINGGARNDYFGVELFYQTTTKSDKKLGEEDGFSYKSEDSLYSFGIDFLGYYPVNTQETEVLAGIGVVNYTFKATLKISRHGLTVSETAKESATSVRFTLGAQHALSQNIKVGANFKYSPVNINMKGRK
jgi:opacity protein-like surface antigen